MCQFSHSFKKLILNIPNNFNLVLILIYIYIITRKPPTTSSYIRYSLFKTTKQTKPSKIKEKKILIAILSAHEHHTQKTAIDVFSVRES